jgi:glycosyltransferase involved in cell wall biosynthesis
MMVANYPRTTGYAWWLMDRFWGEIRTMAHQRGWRAEVVYPPEPVSGDACEGEADSALRRIDVFLCRGGLRDVPAALRAVRREHVRSIYLTDRASRSWRYLVLRVGGVKSIVVHDHTPGDRPPILGFKGLVKSLLNRLPFVTADACVSVSPLMRRRQAVNARLPDARCVTVTNGVILREPLPDARRDLKARLDIPNDAFVIAGVGRLNAYKRFDVAVRCLAELRRGPEPVDARLLLVGDGPERGALEELARALGVRDRVILTGKVSDVWPILCGVDCVHHPSRGEGLSLGILEAMAAGQPLVVPDIPSVCQTIESGKTGLVYADGDIAGATEALRRLAGDPALRQTLGSAARHRVVEQYTLDRTLSEFREKVVPGLLGCWGRLTTD